MAGQTPTTEEEMRAAHVQPVTEHNAPVELVEYDPEWPRLYEIEAARVRAALGDRVLILEHCGSTSVPGLAAKPIIDMLLILENTADEAAYVPDMEAAGFVLHIRESDWHEHRLFRGPGARINLHVFSRDCVEIERMLSFRDRLRTIPEEREFYLRTKRELAAQTWKYVQHYADAKTEVVEGIIARALAAQAG
jgi:GrpB-like predicted nucleotidyltransferase (UPF0157 family)